MSAGEIAVLSLGLVFQTTTTGAGGFYRRHAYPVCVDGCEVMGFGFGEGAFYLVLFETVVECHNHSPISVHI